MKDGCVNNGRNMRGNGVKPDSWSNGKFPNVQIVKLPSTSWWLKASAPDARDAFIEAAHQRDAEREHALNAVMSKQIARFRSFTNPIPISERRANRARKLHER